MKIAFLLVLLVATVAAGRIIQVPPIVSDEAVSLRLDQLLSVESPFKYFGNLSKIYKKEVMEIVDEKEVPFVDCYENPPQAEFFGYFTRAISNLVNRFGLVYDFEQIKYPRSLIDIAVHGNKVYYMLENGVLKVDSISDDFKKISEYKSHQSSQTKIAQGNIVILPDHKNGTSVGFGLFINQNQAFLIDLQEDSFSVLTNYHKTSTFEAAIYLEGGYVAVAYGEDGMKIFYLDLEKMQLRQQATVDKTNSGEISINIKDLAYDSQRKILFILDHHSGVMSLQLIIGAGKLVTQLTSSTIKNTLCNLIYYDKFNEQLYLNCRELHRYHINNWPSIDKKVLPKQDISIKQITSTDKIVALIGRDIFEIIFGDRKAAIYENSLLDKFILKENYFISANEHQLIIGNYTLTPPAIYCSTSDTKNVGNHRLLFKVTAECNASYFKLNHFQPGQLSSDDRCVYSAYVNMQIWQPAQINRTPFVIVAVGLMLLGLAILLWWTLSYCKFRKLKKYLDEYQNLEEEGPVHTTSQSGGHKGNSFSVEMSQSSGDKKQKPNEQQLHDEVQVQSDDLHDIQ